MLNLATLYANSLGLTLTQARADYDGSCIDFAGDLIDHLQHGRLAYFDHLDHPRWRYHAAAEFDGWIHCLWQPRPLPLADYMAKLGAAQVEYPAEKEEEEGLPA